MNFSLLEITENIGIEYTGEDRQIDGIHTLLEATSSQLSFINSDKYTEQLAYTKAAAVLMSEKYLGFLPKGVMALLTDDPYLKMAEASKLFRHIPSADETMPKLGKQCKISKNASFGKDVVLGDDVVVMAGCYVGDHAYIGSGSVLHPNVSVYHHSQIGQECIIHSGVVIGADGYGFAQRSDGSHVKIYQNGNVVIGDNVEIGANSTVDRAAFGTTLIKSGTKIDNLVQIAHNCEIGENCLLVCQTALAGTTKLGNNVVMGGQSGSTGHLDIGDGAIIASRAGVTKSIDGGKVYGGFPIMEQKLWLRMQAKLLRIIKQ